MALLIGCGGAAINPYLAFESIEDMLDRGAIEGIDREKALNNYVKAAGKGVLKVMSKMGISTLASYTGAQLFQAVGISEEVLDEYFTGLTCPTGGITLDDIAADVASPPPAGVPGPARRARTSRARGRRGIPVAPGGRVPPVQPGDRVQAAARHPHRPVQDLQGVHPPRRRPERADGLAARSAQVPRRRASPGTAGRGRARQRDRQALLDRRDELRLDLRRGARDAGHRDEPPGRPVQQRRGRRGRQAVRPRPQRGLAPQRDQAGRLGAVRCHRALPDQLHRHPDQDGPRRETR